jgi:hypothetical protein
LPCNTPQFDGIAPALGFALRTFDLDLGGLGHPSLSFILNGTQVGDRVDLGSEPLQLANGHPWGVSVAYMPPPALAAAAGAAQNGTFQLSLTDLTASVAAHGAWTFDLPLSLADLFAGAPTAWMGFTASTGYYFAAQAVTNFSYALYDDGGGPPVYSVACPARPFTPTRTG